MAYRLIRPGGLFWWAWNLDRLIGVVCALGFLLLLLGLFIYSFFAPRTPSNGTPYGKSSSPFASVSQPSSSTNVSAPANVPDATTAPPALSASSQQIADYVTKLKQNIDAKEAVTKEFNTYLDDTDKRPSARDAAEAINRVSQMVRDVDTYRSRVQAITAPFFQQPCPPECQRLREMYSGVLQAEAVFLQQQSDSLQQVLRNPTATSPTFSGLDDMQWKQMRSRQDTLLDQMDKEMERLSSDHF